jgi:hypothetical protein
VRPTRGWLPVFMDTVAMRRVLLMGAAARSRLGVVVEGRVAVLAVVENLDEPEHGRAQPLAGGPGMSVQQLALQGGEVEFPP